MFVLIILCILTWRGDETTLGDEGKDRKTRTFFSLSLSHHLLYTTDHVTMFIRQTTKRDLPTLRRKMKARSRGRLIRTNERKCQTRQLRPFDDCLLEEMRSSDQYNTNRWEFDDDNVNK